MGYKLYEGLLNAIADERFSKPFRRQLIRRYRRDGLLTMAESIELYHIYKLK